MQSSELLFPAGHSRPDANPNQTVANQGQPVQNFHQTTGQTHHVVQGTFHSPQPGYQQGGFPQVIRATPQPLPRGGMPMPQPQVPTHTVATAGRDYQPVQNQNPGNIGQGGTMFPAAYNRK